MPVETFGNQVGVCWVVCVQMFPKLVLRASIKVDNEEKFFAMRTSLLNLESGFFLCSAMHTICYPGEVIFGLSSEMRNSSNVTFVDCFIMHKGRFIDEVLQSYHFFTVQALETRQE
jgi:hypothetical protein